MSNVWDQARLEQYIANGIEENLTLDYKAAASLDRADRKKAEITKDVSAMANAAGGIIIYGIAEFQDKGRAHRPEKLDPIDRKVFPKEWLEHIIGNIQPRIDGVMIHPVSISTAPDYVVYVVEIPQSHTAHQAKDMRYYKRFNFESVMMADYEIRDVMGRRQYPHIELLFSIEMTQEERRSGRTALAGYIPMKPFGQESKPTEVYTINTCKLGIWAFNAGRVYAQYVNTFVYIPSVLFRPKGEDGETLDKERDTSHIDRMLYYHHYDDNTTRDIIGYERFGVNSSSPNYGPARHVPILPGRYHRLQDVDLRNDFETISLEGLDIVWEVFADNSSALKGVTALTDIEIIDKRNNQE